MYACIIAPAQHFQDTKYYQKEERYIEKVSKYWEKLFLLEKDIRKCGKN